MNGTHHLRLRDTQAPLKYKVIHTQIYTLISVSHKRNCEWLTNLCDANIIMIDICMIKLPPMRNGGREWYRSNKIRPEGALLLRVVNYTYETFLGNTGAIYYKYLGRLSVYINATGFVYVKAS